MEQFQKGDVVRLKSSGPFMKITALGDYSGWTMSPSDTASCIWFEVGRLNRPIALDRFLDLSDVVQIQ
jgi:uncharacterized protein YodC (DUF2158 family)